MQNSWRLASSHGRCEPRMGCERDNWHQDEMTSEYFATLLCSTAGCVGRMCYRPGIRKSRARSTVLAAGSKLEMMTIKHCPRLCRPGCDWLKHGVVWRRLPKLEADMVIMPACPRPGVIRRLEGRPYSSLALRIHIDRSVFARFDLRRKADSSRKGHGIPL